MGTRLQFKRGQELQATQWENCGSYLADFEVVDLAFPRQDTTDGGLVYACEDRQLDLRHVPVIHAVEDFLSNVFFRVHTIKFC